jgi:hypothetical protein
VTHLQKGMLKIHNNPQDEGSDDECLDLHRIKNIPDHHNGMVTMTRENRD